MAIKSFADSIVDVFGRITNRRNTLESSSVMARRVSIEEAYQCYLTGLGNKIVKIKASYALADTLIFETKKDEEVYNKKLDRHVKQCLIWMMTFGRSIAVIMNSGDKLSKPFDKSKVNEYTQIKVFSGDMVSVSNADRNLTSPRYMKPRVYQVRGESIHYSRVVDFTYIPPRELELPAYRYGGISEYQFVYNQLINDGIVERASARILERNSNLFYFVDGFKEAIRQKKEDDVIRYFSILEDHRSIYGAGLLDSADKVESVAQTLTNLSETDQIVLRRIAAVTNIPVSELVGENVRGLNSTGDNERSSWHAYIKSFQDDYVYHPLNELAAMFDLGELHFKDTQGVTSGEQAEYEGKVIDNAAKLNSMGEDSEAYLADKGIITVDPVGDFLTFDKQAGEMGDSEDLDITETSFGDEFKESEVKRDEGGKFSEQEGGEEKPTHEKNLEEFMGESFEGYRGADAVNKLMEEKRGHVPDAFTRDDVGGVTLVWGDENVGLAHILKRREEQGVDINSFLKELPDLIEKGDAERSRMGRMKLTHNGHVAIIAPEFNGEKLTYVFTAYKKL